MDLYEQDVVFVKDDDSGNKVIQMPVTRIDNVEGAIKTINGSSPDDAGNVSLPYFPQSGGRCSGAVVAESMNNDGYAQFRAINGNYGFMIRSDGTNTWLSFTNSGDQYGSWTETGGRPLWINNDSHTVTCGVGIFAPYFQATSDRRLKSDLKLIDEPLNKIDSITGYTYIKRGCDSVIAQDVEKVLPEAVMDNDEGYKTVDYGAVTTLLLDAVKQLKSQVAELTARVEELSKNGS